MSKWIYFIYDENTNSIKIGLATDPKERLNQLQVGCVGQLQLRGAIRGSAELEKNIHAEFDSWHIRGEWFSGNAKLGSISIFDWIAASNEYLPGINNATVTSYREAQFPESTMSIEEYDAILARGRKVTEGVIL